MPDRPGSLYRLDADKPWPTSSDYAPHGIDDIEFNRIDEMIDEWDGTSPLDQSMHSMSSSLSRSPTLPTTQPPVRYADVDAPLPEDDEAVTIGRPSGAAGPQPRVPEPRRCCVCMDKEPRAASIPWLKGSIGEGPNHSNFSH